MGLLAKIFKDSSDSEFKLAQDLVAIAVDWTRRVDIVGAGGQYQVCFFQNFPLETVDEMIERSFAQDIRMP